MPNEAERKEGLLDYLLGRNAIFALLASAGCNGVLIYVSSSPTMRSFMTLGAAVGSLLGYGLTFGAGKGVARYKRVYWAIFSIFIAVLSYGLVMVVNWILNPDVAREYAWIEFLRDQLIGPSIWANSSICLLSGLGSFFIISALAVLSPILDKKR